MTFEFNLIDEPWIPCINQDNEFNELSLRAFFTNAHQIKQITCETPIQNAALMPLLLAILHRVFGPADEDQWEALWQLGQFPMDKLNQYFVEWYERFDLFHPVRPFYQEKDERVKSKSVIHLIHPIGNTGTLFTHVNDDEGISLTPSKAIKYLLTAQSFHTAGLSGLKEKFRDSPFARGVLFFADAPNVFEMLMLNLLPYPSNLTIPKTEIEDKPSWELDEKFNSRNVPNGYLDYLTWSSNRILLIPETTGKDIIVRSMTIAPGLNMDSLSVFSPQKRYEQREKKGEISFSFLYFNTSKALWQDYHSLINLDNENLKPPAIIEWLSELALNGILDDSYHPKLTALGMLADQAKPIFYRQDSIPLPIELLKGQYDIHWIEMAISNAEGIHSQLQKALKTLADAMLLRGTDRKVDTTQRNNLITQWNVSNYYWAKLEAPFWLFIEGLSNAKSDAIENWQSTLKTIALDTLEQTIQIAGNSPWAIKGSISARRQLYVAFKKLFKEE